MPGDSRAKRRLFHIRFADKSNAMQKQVDTIKAQNKILKNGGKVKGSTPRYVMKALDDRMEKLEAIRNFYETRYGRYEELLRAECEGTDDVRMADAQMEDGATAVQSVATTGLNDAQHSADQETSVQNGHEPTSEEGSDDHEMIGPEDSEGSDEQDFDGENFEDDDWEEFDDNQSEESAGPPEANTGRRRRPTLG